MCLTETGCILAVSGVSIPCQEIGSQIKFAADGLAGNSTVGDFGNFSDRLLRQPPKEAWCIKFRHPSLSRVRCAPEGACSVESSTGESMRRLQAGSQAASFPSTGRIQATSAGESGMLRMKNGIGGEAVLAMSRAGSDEMIAAVFTKALESVDVRFKNLDIDPGLDFNAAAYA